ncbi:MAG: dodecin domain-containing protein [Alphaproteobacteria bacterium]
MTDKIYRTTELAGSSSSSIEEAIQDAIDNSEMKGLHWFELLRLSGHIKEGKVERYEVALKAGLTLEEFGVPFPETPH